MPDLVSKEYDPNAGEWFPYGGDGSDNPGTRTRAMYFFHNSLGIATANQSIVFTDEITTGGSGGDVDPDIISWPLLDTKGNPIETYSNGVDTCYRYRFNSGSGQISRIRIGVWQPESPSPEDMAIYERYVNALKTIFGSETTSIEVNRVEQLDGEFWEPGNINVLPFDDVTLPVFDEDAGTDRTAINDYNIIIQPDDPGTDIVEKAQALQESDGIPRFPNVNIGAGSPGGVDSGIINWNAVGVGTGETQSGQFMIGDVVADYGTGDYLLLESTNEDNLFHERVVFVTGNFETASDDFAISIETLDDLGFEVEQGEFTITKLTNAPKLKIKYRMPENTGSSIVITDDIDDVKDGP